MIGTKALHAQLDVSLDTHPPVEGSHSHAHSNHGCTGRQVCNSALNDVEGRHLHNGIKERISQLRERIDANPMIKDNGVCYGVDYVVALSAA